ncbi:hypothetical protein FACS189432_05210 [Bacteroidia bacterium]|nr:hypothetical protein FACS189426_06560 [Bacteroidia bacterium]GHT27934.1 hypothetical protein FACS189432_05210 [Bacteroidia bacterium]
MNDFSMYRFFKGEKENPFDTTKQDKAHFFWFYESVFDSEFSERYSSDWTSFFSDYGLNDKFMQLLKDNDYYKPTDKKGVFELWKDYLFRNKLEGMESEYNTTIAQ